MPLLSYASLIFYLSSMSFPPKEFSSLLSLLGDKLVHMAEYGVLGVLCYRAFLFDAWKSVRRHAFGFAVLAASLYGMSDEIHQAFVPLREADVWDWVADTAGAIVSVWGFYWLSTRGEGSAVSQNEHEVPKTVESSFSRD